MESQRNENSNDGRPSSVYGKIVLSLENCLLPPEKLSQSPSIVDGLDPETECDLRIIGCELIQTAGILLKLPQVAMATGQVLFQRFYFCKSFVRHPMEVTAMGCVCLASKIEEAPRRIRDVINVFHHIRQIRCQKPIVPLVLDQQYIALKTQVIKAERRILKELGFCVHVKHPHKLLVCYLDVLTFRSNPSVVQMAWNYMNDSLRTDVFLRYTPEVIACACIYLTARKKGIVLPKSPLPWFNLFVPEDEKDIQDICRKIVRLYKRPKIDPDVLEAKVETLRKSYDEGRDKLKTTAAVASGNNTPNSITSQPKSKSPSPPPSKIRRLDPSPRKNNDYLSPRSKATNRDHDSHGVERDMKSKEDHHREARLKDERDSRLKEDRDTNAGGTITTVTVSSTIRSSKDDRDRSTKETRDSRSKDDHRGGSGGGDYRSSSSSKKDRGDSRSSSSKRDHNSRSSSRKEKDRDSRSRKHRDYKVVNSDSEEEYNPRAPRSNGNYWKKFYSYA